MSSNYLKNQKRQERERERAEREAREAHALWERINAVWEVPDHAAEAFVALEDAVGEHGARAIADLIKAMLSNPESNDD